MVIVSWKVFVFEPFYLQYSIDQLLLIRQYKETQCLRLVTVLPCQWAS